MGGITLLYSRAGSIERAQEAHVPGRQGEPQVNDTVFAYSPEQFGQNIGDFFAYALVPIPIPFLVLVVLFALVWRFSK